jgi:tRNA modification GTPase
MKVKSTPTIVIAGLPNAGKSSLFNRLVGRRKAIIADEAGTTRDLVTAPVELDG